MGNPNCNVADIPKIAAIAHKHGVVLAVDSTFTTPYLQRPIDLGAVSYTQLVIHPATTTHSQLSDEQLKAAGISAQTVRLSVGLEEPQDLIDDLDGAIRQAVR